jgi:hypothetical protein
MHKERRTRIIRRLVVGLAVAAFVAPAAQARVDLVGPGTQAAQSAGIIQGDDKVIVEQSGDSTVLIHGDDKVLAPQAPDYSTVGYPQYSGAPVAIPAADDKVIVGQPGDSTVLIHGDDKVLAPQAPDYTPVGYPQYSGAPVAGDSPALIHGDDKVFAQTTDVPAASPSSPNSFDWGDALIGAGVALALALLAGATLFGSRRRARPVAA